MKITATEVTTLRVSREVPKDHPTASWNFATVVVRMQTDAGVEGLGHTVSLMPEYARSLTAMVTDLAAGLVGEDPRHPERLAARMMYPANWIGPGGLLNIAACALDIAIWDINGKVAGQPLWRLLGGHRDRARVYDSGSLFSSDIDALQEAAARSVQAGYRAMKMRPGKHRHGRVGGLLEHVQAVRDVIGYEVDLMLDANQTWSPSRAIRAGRALEPLELFWIEDPVLMHDVDGQAEVARSLDVPICAGEYHYGLPPLRRLLEARAVDYLMIDLMRVGGITQFRKAAALAEAFAVPVVSHLLPEVFAHLIAAVPNGLMVEGMPWTQGLFEGGPTLRDGDLVLGDRPGHGLSLDQAFVAAHRVS